jgi:hypothetical protein
MGIDPVHFSQALGPDGDDPIFPLRTGCTDVWWQQSYMRADVISREDLARAIYSAEQDLEDYIGFPLAPEWIVEVHRYPRNYRRNVFGVGANTRWDRKSIILKKGKFIAAGRRYVQVVGQATVGGGTIVWSDPFDGVDTIATITLPNVHNYTANSERQVKCYFEGETTREWEITDPISVTIDAVNVTIVFNFWSLIDPALQDVPPTGGQQALNIYDAITVDTVDVRREYTDYSQHSVEFFWEPRSCTACGGSGCAACELTVQCGCLHVRDVDRGIGVPTPADYSSGAWNTVSFTRCEEPDIVKLWYLAGDMDDNYVNGVTTDPLKRRYAESIAYMATARLERNFCSCGALTALANDLRTDLTRSDRQGPSFFNTPRDLDNPFGTRKGEVMAWRRFSKLIKKRPSVAVI